MDDGMTYRERAEYYKELADKMDAEERMAAALKEPTDHSLAYLAGVIAAAIGGSRL